MSRVNNIMVTYKGKEVYIDVEKYTDPCSWTPDIVTIDDEDNKGYADYCHDSRQAIWQLAHEEANYKDPYDGL